MEKGGGRNVWRKWMGQPGRSRRRSWLNCNGGGSGCVGQGRESV